MNNNNMNGNMNGSPDRMLAVNVDDRAPAPTNVPDLMKVGPIQGNPNMDVETDILDPVVFSQDFCRFRLQNKGILHSNSKITLALTGVSASGVRVHPIGVGVHALVQRAVLKIGGKTICETDDFICPAKRENKEETTCLQSLGFEPHAKHGACIKAINIQTFIMDNR